MEVFKLIAALLVIVFIFYLAWRIPQIVARKGGMGTAGKNIRVIERVQVTRDSYIVLVRAFDKVLVLGVTPGGMTALGGVDASDVEEAGSAQQARGFTDVLREAMADTLPEGRMRDAFDRFINRKKDGGAGRENEETKKD